jgi:transcriptional regulator with XRE-family HTH domain
MKAYGWFKEALEEAEGSFEYKLESLELEVTEKILEIMEAKGVNRSELAQRLGVSKAAVSKLLNDGSNMTLKRLLTISEALGHDLTINLVPSGIQSEEKVVQYSPRSRSDSPEGKPGKEQATRPARATRKRVKEIQA